MTTFTAKLLRLPSPLLLMLPLAVACPRAVHAQAAAPSVQAADAKPLRFEVVSIRQSASPEVGSSRDMLPGGRFVVKATPVRAFLRNAFGNSEVRLPSGTGWVDDITFDLEATTEGRVDVKTPEQFKQVVLSLLEDRFGLKFHREQKEAPIYWLVLDKPGKLGPDLKPSSPDAKPSQNNTGGPRIQMHVTAASMTDIAALMTRQAGRPVEDHTGLSGKYDFDVAWASQMSTDSSDPTLFTVLKERLGLKLQSEKGATEVIVIDRIEKPSQN